MEGHDEQPTASLPRLLAGRYRLGARRGSSVEAAAFEAVDEQLQRDVLVKIVHPDLLRRREVRAAISSTVAQLAELHHPNLAGVLDHGRAEWDGHEVLFVVREQLAGGSLRDVLDRGRLLSPSQVVVVGLDACKALDALHRRGVVHGDVRPATMVFGADRRLRLVDAGITYLAAEASGGVAARSNDVAKYAAPEQASGGPAQPKSDVYALCLTLLEALTGSVPFVGDSTVATLANRVDRLLPVSADFGPLAAVFERAGRPDPSDRSSAADFGRGLVQAAEQLPRPAPLPLLVNTLFAADPAVPGAPTEPTGPLVRPAAVAPVAPEAVEPSPVPPPTAEAPVAPAAAPGPVAPAAGSQSPVPPPGSPAGPVPPPGSTRGPIEHVDLASLAAGTPPPSAATAPPPPPSAPVAAAMSSAPTVAEGISPAATAPLPSVAPPTELLPAAPVGGPDAEFADSAPDDDEFDPEDEFPEPPPHPSGNRKWFLALLAVLAVAGGALAWWNTRPEEMRIPSVAGLSAAEARNLLADFSVVEVEEPHETVPAGQVTRTDPPAESVVDKGSTVTLYVSTGPAPRTLPELTGLTVADATAKLEGLGLVVELADPVFDETVPAGTVISWTVPESPALTAGGTVLLGTAVRIVSSAGPQPRVLPDLTGMTLADATASLTELGLTVAQAEDEFHPTIPAGQVVRQDPAIGAEVARGSTVTVALSKGPEMVTLPPLAGLSLDQIRATLESAGFVLGAVTGDPTQPLVHARIRGEVAKAGQREPKGTTVDLEFAPSPTTTTTA